MLSRMVINILDPQMNWLCNIFNNLMNYRQKELSNAMKMLITCRGSIVTSGVGKSAFAAQKMATSLRSFSFKSIYLNPVDSLHGDIGYLSQDDVVVLISNSGTGSELITLLRNVKSKGCSVLAIVGKNSAEATEIYYEPLFSMTDVLLTIGEIQELGGMDLPTTSVLAQIMICDGLVVTLAKYTGRTNSNFLENHTGGTLGQKGTI